MEVLRYKVDNNYDYYLINDNKKLGTVYCDNGDIYFTPFEQGKEIDFIITKENMIIYNLFTELLKAFEQVNVFRVTDIDLSYCNNFEERKRLFEIALEENQKLKNSDIYKKVFLDGKITWISDDCISFDYNTADAMTISKEKDYFKIKFTYYENELSYIRSIRIRNARSRQKPFNALMIDLYNNLIKYDPNFHQIHIDECLYTLENHR